MINEIHICNAPNGHDSSVACWCEPVCIYLYKNAHGITVKIVEHDDDGSLTLHRADVIRLRDAVPDWVTRALDAVYWQPPPEGLNERSF